MTAPLRVGISECLLGRDVRYDGGRKHARFLINALGPRVEWVPVCPEVGAGFGIPRPAMDLVDSPEGTRLLIRNTGEDLTATLERWTAPALDDLADLDGFVLKADSPSCGMLRVPRYRDADETPVRDGAGLFAAALIQRYPGLPVEEAERLDDPARCAAFVERMERFRREFRGGGTGGLA